MARTGGILTFSMIAAGVLGFLLSTVAQNSPALGIVALLLMLGSFVLWFIVMIALKVNLAQNGYHRAGGLIWAILLITILTIVLSVVAGIAGGTQLAQTGGTPDPATLLRAFGVWAVIILLISMALQVCFLLLGVRLSEYAQIGGGVWKGGGIVLIIATAAGLLIFLIYIVAVLTQLWGLAIVAGILGLIDLILWLVVWIMIGVGFMSDANRMALGDTRR